MRLHSLLILPALLLAGCRETPRSHRWFAMDTNLEVTLYGKRGSVPDAEAFSRAEAEVARLAALLTDYSDLSALAKIRGRVGDTVPVDRETREVLSAALAMTRASGGTFDITLHDLKTLWGLDGDYAGHVPEPRQIDSLMRDNPTYHASPAPEDVRLPLELLPDGRAVLRRDNRTLDVGGIAKGYIVDRIHALLDSLGLPNHIVQAGGDIRVGGRKAKGAWVVGIRHPRKEDSFSGTLRSSGPMSISTAGDYERFFIRDGVRYHHVFDPRTGRPVPRVCAVTVVSNNSLSADAIDDALFALGPGPEGMKLARSHGVRAVWFLDGAKEPSDGSALCAVAMPEMDGLLALDGVRACGSP